MNYWIVKQEPESYSWSDFVKEGRTSWTGVRKGDLVFFYHSVSEKQIVGVAKVARENYPDPTTKEAGWVAVDLVPVKPLPRPVTLEEIKADATFKDVALLRNSRLSVTPLTPEQGKRTLKLGQTN